MISKNRFVSIINALIEADELRDKINGLMRNARDNIRNDFMNAGGIMICHTDIVIELLEYMFNDEQTDWIGWWIYEYGFTQSNDAKVYDSKGNVIVELKTAGDLYDFLISETMN